MKLPLIVEGKPSINASGPLVYLFPGKWRLEHNVKDAIIGIMLELFPLDYDTLDNLTIGGDQTIQVYIKKSGSEPQITIYAVQI